MYYHQFCKISQKREIALPCPRWEFRGVHVLTSIWHSQPEGEDSIESLIGNIRVVHVHVLASIPFRGVHVLPSILSILWIWLQLRIGTAVMKWWPISGFTGVHVLSNYNCFYLQLDERTGTYTIINLSELIGRPNITWKYEGQYMYYSPYPSFHKLNKSDCNF